MGRRPRPSSKFSPAAIVTDHYRTLRNFDTKRPQLTDYLLYVGLPVLLAGASWTAGAQARNLPEVLAAVAIFTGLIFNVFVLLFELTMRAVDKSDLRQRVITRQLADELRANVSYAVLLGIVLTAVLGGLAMLTDTRVPLNTTPTALLVLGGSQLLLTIGMILKRVRALFNALTEVETERIP